jgi:tetratricopeptide (TPR) repeat protein
VPTTKRTRALLAAVCLGAAQLGAAGEASAARDPSAEVKRQLFPAQNALGLDSLDLADREAGKALALDPNVAVTHLILGEVAWRKGEFGRAKSEYETALRLGDAEAEAQAGLALVALAADDLAAAEKAAAAAVAADKGLWLANYAYGRVLVAKGQYDAAFKAFEKGKGLKTRAERRDLFEAGMGLVALAENDAAGAETNFIKARAQAPNTVEHTMNLAAMYEATNQWGQAVNVLQAAEAQVGSSPMLSYRLGRAFENQEQWNDALRQYQKALKADSTFVSAMAALGHLYLLDRSKTPAAVEMLTRAVSQHPTPASRLDLGLALSKAGKPDEAVPHLEQVLAVEPGPEVKMALARAYVKADQLDKGLPLYEDPDVAMEATAQDLLDVASALVKAKRFDAAGPWLGRALEKDPNTSEVYAKRGFIALMADDYAGAERDFLKKLEMDPKSTLTWLNLGTVYMRQEKKAEALAAYRKATQLAPNSAQVWIQLGQALAADSAAAAQKVFDRALALDPPSLAARRGKGLTYLVLEQYAQAISPLKEVTEADPNDAEAWVYLGQAYLGSGKQAEARSCFQRALKVDPGNKEAQELLQQMSAASSSR